MLNVYQKEKEKSLLTIASGQGGYFTAKQALQAGYSYRLQHYHKSHGYWQEIDRGVFRLSDYPSSPNEDLVRWSLWSKNREDIPQAVISHETALSVHEIGDIMPGKVHFTVPSGFRKRAPGGCIIHKGVVTPEEIENREGFFVTSPIKTILDTAEGNLELNQLEKTLRDGLSRGLIRIQDIQKANLTKKAKEKLRIVIEEIKKHPIL